jgi:hypothetical protein
MATLNYPSNDWKRVEKIGRSPTWLSCLAAHLQQRSNNKTTSQFPKIDIFNSKVSATGFVAHPFAVGSCFSLYSWKKQKNGGP